MVAQQLRGEKILVEQSDIGAQTCASQRRGIRRRRRAPNCTVLHTIDRLSSNPDQILQAG
jgi:hypothetical protein